MQEMNLVPIGTYEFFPQLVRLVANERHWQSHPYSQQKLGRRMSVAVKNRSRLAAARLRSVFCQAGLASSVF